MKHLFEAVLFDLDGTLADTAGDLIGALNALLVEEKQSPLSESLLRPMVSTGSLGLIPAGFGISSTDPNFEPLKTRFLALYARDICINTRLFEGIPAVLEALKAQGLPWGIVTNKSRVLTLKLIPPLHLEETACVVCGDDAPRAKPWPDTLFLAAQQLSVSPENCLYVGDYHRDIEAARAAGMKSVAVTYGYRHPDYPIDEWGADFQIDHPLELLPILFSQKI